MAVLALAEKCNWVAAPLVAGLLRKLRGMGGAGFWAGWVAPEGYPRQMGRRLCVTLLLLASVCLCAGQAGAARKTKITFWMMSGVDQTVGRYLKEFERQNPDIQVDMQVRDWEFVRQKLLTVLAARSGVPDLVVGDREWVGAVFAAGGISPVDEFLEPEFFKRFLPSTVDTYTYQGRIFAVPWDLDFNAVYYRNDLVEPAMKKARLKSFPTNRDDFLRLAKEITKDLNGDGVIDRYAIHLAEDEIQGDTGYGGWYFNFFLPSGGRLLEESERRAAFNDAIGIDTLQFYVDLVRKHQVAVVYKAQRGVDPLEAMRQGFISMHFVGPWWQKDLRTRAPELRGKWRVAAYVPFVKRGVTPGSCIGGFNLIIPSLAEHKPEAVRLLRFLLSEGLMRKYFGDISFPAQPGFWTETKLHYRYAYFGGQEIFSIFAQGARVARPVRFYPHYEEIHSALNEALWLAVNGQKTVKEALDDAAAKVNEVFAQDERRGKTLTGGAQGVAFRWTYVAIPLGLFALMTVGIYAGARRRIPFAERLWQARSSYLFVSPFFILFSTFGLFSIGFSFYLSLCDWNGISRIFYLGLDNYRELIHDPLFHNALRVTGMYVAAAVALVTALALLLAVCLNGPVPGRNVFRTAYYLPAVTTVVAIVFIFLQLYQPETGSVNVLLRWLGRTIPALAEHFKIFRAPPHWTTDRTYALPAVLILTTWGGIGWTAIFFLAGLQSIPRELYEAAHVDGASSAQSLWHITIPLLRPMTLFVVFTTALGAFNVFTEVLLLTKGGPVHATETIYYYLYTNAFLYLRFGYACSIAYVMLGVAFFLTLPLTYLIVRSRDERG